MSSTNTNKYSAPAAACAAEVLRLLKESLHPLTLTDIQRSINRTKSLTYRVLRELEAQEFVERDSVGRYRLGIEVFEMGTAYFSQSEAMDVIRRILQELADSTHETVNLGLLRGSEVLYVMKYLGQSSYVTISRVGGRVPANCVAIGKALLAGLPLDELRRIMHEPLPQMTPNSIRSLKALERELEVIREQGYAIDNQEAVLGRCGLATTVELPHTDLKHAAISLSAPSHLMPEKSDILLELLLSSKTRLEREANAHENMRQHPGADDTTNLTSLHLDHASRKR